MNSSAVEAPSEETWLVLVPSILSMLGVFALLLGKIRKSSCCGGATECFGEEGPRRGASVRREEADKDATLTAVSELGQRLDELARRLPVTQKSSRRSRRSSVGSE